MKDIFIITPPELSDISDQISEVLLFAGYNPNIVVHSYDSVYLSLSKITPDDCQLIISVDGFGFEQMFTDGGSYYNQTPVNVLVILFNHATDYPDFFNKRINYTISFLVPSDDDVEYFHTNYPHIYHVDKYDSIQDIPSYLDDFDWRF